MLTTKPFLDVFRNGTETPPPIWLMRQAGRYLPEYRDIRRKAASFLDFCYTPELAVEATLQPIRRFGFDAAIIFSDILVIPDALGQRVHFVEGEGPRLDPIGDMQAIERLRGAIEAERLEPVYEAIRQCRRALPGQVALIGFAGGPWTLATYMIAGRGTPDQAPARLFAYQQPVAFGQLIEKLTDAVAQHLIAQIEAGAEAVQIFDSWAGILPEAEFTRWCEEPLRRIVWLIKQQCPNVPVIGFPRGMPGGFARFVASTGISGLGLDTSARIGDVAGDIGAETIIQGNLDPLVLVAGGPALDHAVEAIIMPLAGRRHIFNLGHGILPQTPIAHVEWLIKKVRR